MLSQFMANPRCIHWEAAKCILKYLKGTQNTRLTYRTHDNGLTGYTDADWASHVKSVVEGPLYLRGY
jgi:hypothetical protein